MQLPSQSQTNRFSLLENHEDAYDLNTQASSSSSPPISPAQQFLAHLTADFKPNLLKTRPFHPSIAGAQIYHEEILSPSNEKVRMCMKEERRFDRDREFVRCIAWVEVGELGGRGKGKAKEARKESVIQVVVKKDGEGRRPGWRDMVRCLKEGGEDGAVEVGGEEGWAEVLEWGYDEWCEICGRADCWYMWRGR